MDHVNRKINEAFLNTINNVGDNNIMNLQKEFDFLRNQLDATHSEISKINEKRSQLLKEISVNVDKEMTKQKGGKKKTRGKLHRKSYKKKTRRKYQTK